MQVARDLEHDGGLIGEGLGAPDVLLRDSHSVEPIEYAEHAEQFVVAS